MMIEHSLINLGGAQAAPVSENTGEDAQPQHF